MPAQSYRFLIGNYLQRLPYAIGYNFVTERNHLYMQFCVFTFHVSVAVILAIYTDLCYAQTVTVPVVVTITY